MTVLTDTALWHCAHQRRCLELNRCVCGHDRRRDEDFDAQLRRAMEKHPNVGQPKEQTMKRHIGTKIVNAMPMTRGEYNEARGWTVPANEDPADAGYIVEYTDGGVPNTPTFAGYVSWSPKEQFENAYRETSGMSFGLAVEAIKKGMRVTREAWPRGVFVYHVPSASYPVQTGAAKAHFGEGSMVPYMAYLAIKRADDQVCMFAPGVDSILADDWQIVD